MAKLSQNVRNRVSNDEVPEAHTKFKARVYVVQHTKHKFVAVNAFTYALNIPKWKYFKIYYNKMTGNV
jgi:hypothetical protein